MKPTPAKAALHPTRIAARHLRHAACALLLVTLMPQGAWGQVYRWVDAEGVTHLSSEKPPAGVKAERIDVPRSSRSTASQGGRSTATPAASAPVSAAQAADRASLLGQLRTRECVIALEALDRMTSGTEPTTAAEIRRLKQTTDLNCSTDPVRRREEEGMAARLRVANSPSCVQARNELADMLAPDSTTPREQLRTQQAFVDEHCSTGIR